MKSKMNEQYQALVEEHSYCTCNVNCCSEEQESFFKEGFCELCVYLPKDWPCPILDKETYDYDAE